MDCQWHALLYHSYSLIFLLGLNALGKYDHVGSNFQPREI